MNSAAEKILSSQKYILWFDNSSLQDLPIIGGKNAGIAEMYRVLTKKNIRIPNGFAVTADAYRSFLEHNNLIPRLRAALAMLDTRNITSLENCGETCRSLILESNLPNDISDAICSSYRELSGKLRDVCAVAVRSSATAEDLPSASFAGLHESYLNIQGETQLLDYCRKCFASLFTNRAISYRQERGYDHLSIALSVGVQQMVRSDLASSGVMFTIDTETGFRDVVLINASYGLGENIVKGRVSPDEFYVFKPTLKTKYPSIIKRSIGSKETKLIYQQAKSNIKEVPVPLEDRERSSLSDQDILALASWGCTIEDHFSNLAGHFSPMDIEWAKDGFSGELFILQARPETVHAQHIANEVTQYCLKNNKSPLLKGSSVGSTIVHGKIRLIKNLSDLALVQAGEILVASRTEPDWEPVMRKAFGIVTDQGGRTCHAAIVSRELGIPAVIGTITATHILKNGQSVTLSCAEGSTGYIYDGTIPYETTTICLKDLPSLRTKILINIADPSRAFRLSFLPVDGVGLARIEFIISNHIGIHPMALLKPENVPAPERLKINSITKQYPNKEQYFIEKLAEGIGTIAAAFYPREVIVRLSDFKTNEYAGLLGGSPFEPPEENPMIGFRGASRYYHQLYREAFALECAAIKRVREEMGLINIKVMIPFCRTLEEGKKVLNEMELSGLSRSKNGLEVYVMCEVPSNVVLGEEFADMFDGISIGSNDLTQLILGLDRDSEIISYLFDESNTAVTKMIAEVIKKTHSKGKPIGICGQAPSDYPEFAQFLIREGIDSISLSPDAVYKTFLSVERIEHHLQ